MGIWAGVCAVQRYPINLLLLTISRVESADSEPTALSGA